MIHFVLLRQDYCAIEVGLEIKGLSASACLMVPLQACSTIPLHPQIQPRNERRREKIVKSSVKSFFLQNFLSVNVELFPL